MSLGEPGIRVIVLSLVSVTAGLSLLSVAFGLFSTLTGKDSLPRRIRGLLRRVPASAEDFRLRGMSLTLTGAATMLIALLLTNDVVERFAAAGWTGYVPSASPAFPDETVILVNAIAALAAVACFIGAYTLGVRVRYASTRASTGPRPEMPPA